MKLYCLLTCMTLLFSNNTTPIVSPVSPIQTQEEEEISTYAVETKWYYRTYNGVYQKRLWSLSKQKWLTDWINVRQ